MGSSSAGAGDKSSSDHKDVAMQQVAREALPIWKLSKSWEKAWFSHKPKEAARLFAAGGVLDYTNNRGFACVIVVGEGGVSSVSSGGGGESKTSDTPLLFAPLSAEEESHRKKILSGEAFYEAGSGSKKSALLRGEDNPYHMNNRKQSEWDKMSFGAKVNDKDGKAKMYRKSGF